MISRYFSKISVSLLITLFISLSFISESEYVFANPTYEAGVGSTSISTRIGYSDQGLAEGIALTPDGYFNFLGYINYVPGSMTCNKINISYTMLSRSQTNAWHYDSVGYYDLNLVRPDGSQVYWTRISVHPWDMDDNETRIIGSYYLDNNYTGVVITGISGTNASGSSLVDSILKFDFSSLVFSPSETQFNNLSENAASANNNSWYNGIYGGSSESVGDVTGYIKNTQLPNIDNKINNLDTKVSNLDTLVTNINNSIGIDHTPPAVDWGTVSGATATSGSSIGIVITAIDNVSPSLQYSVNGSTYAALPANGKISAPVTSSGPNAITVSVKDEAGNVGSKTKTIWKLE